jgi:hypothetical protein
MCYRAVVFKLRLQTTQRIRGYYNLFRRTNETLNELNINEALLH